MRLQDYITKIAPRAFYYRLVRRGLLPPINPLTLTFSVTAACQSRCKTCNIGNVYLANPKLTKQNLTLDEIEKTFKSLGKIYFFNVSGGEPFMRPDLADIIELACRHLQPNLIHIPTNALATKFIGKTTRKILDHMERYLPSSVPISIKPSIDGIGDMHDFVRGYKGNFAKLEKTIDALLAIRKENPRLHVDLGTVISQYNLHHLDEIEDWVHARGIESYRHEIAEQRAEFHNLGDPITPTVDTYEMLIRRFKEKIQQTIQKKAFLTRTTEAVRVVYYDVVVDILKKRKQVTPCFGGISNIHMNYNGEIWPCCVLGNDQSLGNVRKSNYDIQALLKSSQAIKARNYIAAGKCACPLANQWLNNVLLTPRHMLKVLYTLLVKFRQKIDMNAASDNQKPVNPGDVKVKVSGFKKKKALVMHKLGTIPDEHEEADLPVFESDKHAQ